MSEEKSPEVNLEASNNKDTSHQDNLYLTNPLHGVGLKTVLQELVSHYGFDILYAYLNINCFRSNPSIAASAKFLKKTDWAREKVEVFYLYQYKNLPSVSSEQFKLPPRERIVPEHHKPREPAILSIEDGERLQDKRAKNASYRDNKTGDRKGSSKAYNEQRSERRNSSYTKSPSDVYKKSDNKSDQKSEDDFGDAYPAPPKDPWGNFKGGK